MSSESIQRRKVMFIAWMDANGLNVNKVATAAKIPVNTLYSYVDDGPRATKVLGALREDAIARAFDLPVEAIFGPLYEPGEVPPEPNFVGVWREHRHMTQTQLAQKLGTTDTIVQLLEAGEIPLSSKWLRRLAEAFSTQQAFVMLDPRKIDRDMLDAAEIPQKDHDQVLKILQTFKGAAAV